MYLRPSPPYVRSHVSRELNAYMHQVFCILNLSYQYLPGAYNLLREIQPTPPPSWVPMQAESYASLVSGNIISDWYSTFRLLLASLNS